MQKTINGITFRKMIISGAKLLDVNREKVDALNVFPVPDGDTGTNMTLTAKSVLKELADTDTNSLEAVATAVVKGALKGARGNSGVILSQIFKGFCERIIKKPEISIKDFAEGLESATKVAYNAVSKPKEGTILTVIRVISEDSKGFYKKCETFESYFEQVLASGELILAKTPELLAVLKKAGVVDSGGYGLLLFLRGMVKGFLGEEIEGNIEDTQLADVTATTSNDNADFTELADIEFAYCTEFFIINIKPKTTLSDIDMLREKYNTLGDSVLVIGDLQLIKVHVHTNKVGIVLSSALQLGELDNIKIENMLEQNRKLKVAYESQRKELAMLAISSGEGINNIFKDLSVDKIISGGQTMNPSADDIAQAVRKINANHVFVFPNNKNIILAAEQAKSLVEGRTIHVIPTKSIPQGIAAALCFEPEESFEQNKVNMANAIDNVTVGQVTYAVRNTQIDNFKLKEGDIIGLDQKTILATGNNIEQVTEELVAKMKKQSHQIITLYYGEGVSEEDANALCEKLREKYTDCDVDVHFGGQPIYYYFISLE